MNIFGNNQELETDFPTFSNEPLFPFTWETPFTFENLDDDIFGKDSNKELMSKQSKDTAVTKTGFTGYKSDHVFNDLVDFWESNETAKKGCQTEQTPQTTEFSEAPKINLSKNQSFSNQSTNEYLHREYCEVVREVLKNSHKSEKELVYRKDVINKYILRSFRKSICKLFRGKFKRPGRSSKPFEITKGKLLKEAHQLGIINLEHDYISDEFQEFIWWMAISKMTHKSKLLFNQNNKAIEILSDILTHYSHAKMDLVFGNRNISWLFQFYMDNLLETSLQRLPKHKREIYTKAAFDISQSFK